MNSSSSSSKKRSSTSNEVSPSAAKRGRAGSKSPSRSPQGATSKSPLQSDYEEIYDRQIRLWGREAQVRLKHARVMVLGGAQRGLAAEVVKNLTLAGVGHLTIVDNAAAPENDQPSIFRSLNGEKWAAQVVAEGAKRLNPMVSIECIVQYNLQTFMEKQSGLLKGVNLLILCDVPLHLTVGATFKFKV
jgi:hypothetical protein